MQIDSDTTPHHQHAAYRDWKDWSVEDFGRCGAVEARYFEAELTKAGVILEADTPILEVGFGNGAFAAWANARGLCYAGTELDGELVKQGGLRGWQAFQSTLSLDTLRLSVSPRYIIIFDVLEHLTTIEILELLISAVRTMADGGLLLARVPSGDSPFARYIQHGDVTHRSVLGSSAIRQLSKIAGLEVVQIRSPVLPLRGVGLRRWLRRALVIFARNLVTPIIRIVFHDSQSTIITANMLVVLRKPSTIFETERLT